MTNLRDFWERAFIAALGRGETTAQSVVLADAALDAYKIRWAAC